MGALTIVLLFLLGLALTIKGGDFFVDAASWIAEVSGIPKFLIGATIVSLATTLPELLVSLMAAVDGSIGIAVGNAVGSVTANVGLIMGISVIWLATAIHRREQAFKFIMMAAANALLFVSSLSGSLSIPGSVVLLAMFLAFMVESVIGARRAMRADTAEERPAHDRRTVLVNIVKFVLGVAGIVAGARLMVDYGTALARLLGVPESIIGATLVAIGTSLPELVTTITALVKKHRSHAHPAAVQRGLRQGAAHPAAEHPAGHAFLPGAGAARHRADADHRALPPGPGRGHHGGVRRVRGAALLRHRGVRAVSPAPTPAACPSRRRFQTRTAPHPTGPRPRIRGHRHRIRCR